MVCGTIAATEGTSSSSWMQQRAAAKQSFKTLLTLDPEALHHHMDAGVQSAPDAPPAETLVDAALRVLKEPDPFRKATLAEIYAVRWLRGDIPEPYPLHSDSLLPPSPSRLSTMKLLPSSKMPKLGKGGNLQSRQAIVHSLVHTESWAIDLSWDIIARFGKREAMPREFFTDFVRVARDEGRHFTLLCARLEELGSSYGAFPVHDGLWDSATKTSDDLLARLAIEHCVHEARGLDVLPITISRLRSGGDDHTADLLQNVVYPEEITHCAAGVKWFRYLCHRTTMCNEDHPPVAAEIGSEKPKIDLETNESDINKDEEHVFDQTIESNTEGYNAKDRVVIEKFHTIVRNYFRGSLKPPFNKKARKEAGFGPEWYEPLAVKESPTN